MTGVAEEKPPNSSIWRWPKGDERRRIGPRVHGGTHAHERTRRAGIQDPSHCEAPNMNPSLPLACPSFDATPNDPEKRLWLIATGVAGGAAALATAVPFVSSFAPSERARAAGGPVEVDLSDIPPGGSRTVEWRGKPVWIVRRTPEMIASLQGHDDQLVDPQSARDQQPVYAKNTARSIRPRSSSPSASARTWAVRPAARPRAAAIRACPRTGRGASFAPATARPSTAPAASSNKPAPADLRSRPIDMPATRGSSSATTRQPEGTRRIPPAVSRLARRAGPAVV